MRELPGELTRADMIQSKRLLPLAVLMLAACGPAAPTPVRALNVLATTSLLADIAQNVAGDRAAVGSLLPPGADPHGFEPAPGDAARAAASTVLIVNGAGYETFLDDLLQNVGGDRLIIDASRGLTPRGPAADRPPTAQPDRDRAADPHFWLDPLHVIRYVENIRDGLSLADPAGAAAYAVNAEAYAANLRELDRYIVEQVAGIPPARRLLVTDHESLGYFADRYGFTIVGVVAPGPNSQAQPTAQELVRLIDAISAAGAPAVFVGAGVPTGLAEQIAAETGSRLITGLYLESIGPAGGPAATYLDLMRHNAATIAEALR